MKSCHCPLFFYLFSPILLNSLLSTPDYDNDNDFQLEFVLFDFYELWISIHFGAFGIIFYLHIQKFRVYEIPCKNCFLPSPFSILYNNNNNTSNTQKNTVSASEYEKWNHDFSIEEKTEKTEGSGKMETTGLEVSKWQGPWAANSEYSSEQWTVKTQDTRDKRQ